MENKKEVRAAQIWYEKQPEDYGNGRYILPQDWQIEAMEEYAKQYSNQKLDEAANQAIIKDEDNNDHWYECLPFPEVDVQSILSLKDVV